MIERWKERNNFVLSLFFMVNFITLRLISSFFEKWTNELLLCRWCCLILPHCIFFGEVVCKRHFARNQVCIGVCNVVWFACLQLIVVSCCELRRKKYKQMTRQGRMHLWGCGGWERARESQQWQARNHSLFFLFRSHIFLSLSSK